MNYIEAKELFKKIDIELTREQYESFNNFEKELLEWNEKINLTTITEDIDIWLKHFVDSAAILKYIDNEKSKKEVKTLIDIGTGAGFPSIPLLILKGNLKVTMLDSLNKRVIYLKEVCAKLNFSYNEIVHGRAEDFGKDIKYREQYDYVTARAVANLATLSELCLPFLKVGGKFLCMKGTSIEEEVTSAKKAINLLGGKIEKIDTFNLPNSNIERNVIIINKIKETPNGYPRKAGLPSSKPL